MTTKTTAAPFSDPEQLRTAKKALLAAARWFCFTNGCRYHSDEDNLYAIIQYLEHLEGFDEEYRKVFRSKQV